MVLHARTEAPVGCSSCALIMWLNLWFCKNCCNAADENSKPVPRLEFGIKFDGLLTSRLAAEFEVLEGG